MFDKGNVCIFMREVFDFLNASVRIERRRKTVPAICLSRAPGTTFDVAGRRETGLKVSERRAVNSLTNLVGWLGTLPSYHFIDVSVC